MNSWRRALRFIIAQQRGTGRGVRRSSVVIAVGKKRVNSDLYELIPSGGQSNNPVIVFLHGMSPLGIADPRQVRVAEALAYAGFRVLCPEMPEIRQLRVEAASVENFATLLRALSQNEQLCPSRKFALFAPSFSGAICLKVAADPILSRHITAIAAVGAFSRIERSLEKVMHDDAADPYARLIILANFLPRLPEGRNLGRYYLAAVQDNWNATAAKNPALASIKPTDKASQEIRRLTRRERNFLNRIHNDQKFRVALGNRLLTVMQDTLAAYNVSEVADKILSPVFLLHGAADDVIPARESIELYPLLHEARLVVTPLMDHSHAKVTLKMVSDAFRLVAGFAWYFRKAAQ